MESGETTRSICLTAFSIGFLGMRYLTSTNRKGYARMLFHRFSEKEWNFLKNPMKTNKCFSCLMFYSRTGNAGRLEEEITDMKVDILSREYPPKVYGRARGCMPKSFPRCWRNVSM